MLNSHYPIRRYFECQIHFQILVMWPREIECQVMWPTLTFWISYKGKELLPNNDVINDVKWRHAKQKAPWRDAPLYKLSRRSVKEYNDVLISCSFVRYNKINILRQCGWHWHCQPSMQKCHPRLPPRGDILLSGWQYQCHPHCHKIFI